MSTDTDRIVNICQSFHQFWSLPFQVAIALYLLHQQVHLAFLTGLGLALLLIPVNRWVAVKIGHLSKEMMSQKDARVKVMSELLAGIRVIKYYAWEKCFKAKILSLRDLELKSLKGQKYLDALCVYFWATTPVLMSILTFLTFSLVYKGQLTAARVFTSVALFNMLISPLNAFPWVINGLVEAWVSLKRVQEFMWLHDLNLAAYYCDEPLRLFPLDSLTPESDDPAIDISLGRFSWQQLERGKKTQAALKDISLTIQPGQLIGICGRVGAGKSSLLAAIIGEMRKTNGKIFVNNLPEGFAYAAQEAWIQHATVRDNILFGMAFDEEKYSRVIEGCALQEDLAILPAGDLTEVGENGVTLSGGQKARVALARAVYQDKSIYLLDDPLAAVDANVGAHLFNQCILGLLRGKTRLLCTHHTQFLSAADVVIAIEKGRIAMAGRPEEVLSEQVGFRPAKTAQVDESGSRLYEDKAKDNVTKVHSQKDGEDEEIRHEKGILVKEEEKEVGAVAFHVYKSYWLAIGNCLAIAILISMFLMQASRNVNDWWLSYWVTATSCASNSSLYSVDLLVVSNSSWWYSNRPSIGTGNANETERTLTFYLGIYGALSGANSIFTLFRAFLYAYGGICAATSIHRQLLLKILYAPVAFFDITPIGRIINRFSSDVYAIDDSLPFILNILLAQLFGVLGAIAITCYGLPWLSLSLLPLGIIYYFIQRYYRRTSRELKRLSSVTRSPIYAHFSESLTGLESIRAYRQTERFAKENEEKLDINQRANFGEYAASQWLSIRLQMLGVTMVGAVAFIAVLEHQYGTVNPGLVGLALSYALSVTALLSGVVTSFTETEKLMLSVERAEQYISGLPKEPERMTNALPGWPSHGIVTFKKVTLIYREGLPPALNELTFQTRPYEKVGIVGRTGAGKSSLFSCLFQMTEISSGEILIDGIDVSSILQQSLRSRLAVIPQDPFLFSGTIKQNLDPSSTASDAELRFVLAKCHLLDAVDALGGLDVNIGERGRQFSVGERQLLCLARAMLTQTKVLCIDEATASVDKQTDSWLQQAIRQEFAYSTVLTIAHRIETILDSDRVLVMDRGQVAEFAKPDLLLSDPNSLFSQLVNSSEI
ncbi:ATP-binding cassette sub-family C member 10-like [Oscarella lobularis]|uniref:ATP-binding cassette sub-family C member 10-like n=1 Tax=Oscarella lobularis TaxID=121494 RepID=UPI003313CD9E